MFGGVAGQRAAGSRGERVVRFLISTLFEVAASVAIVWAAFLFGGFPWALVAFVPVGFLWAWRVG